MRLIDGDALHIETIGVCDANGNVYGSAEVVFAEDITNAPTIDPVKHGRWLQGYPITCSLCGKPAIEIEDNDLRYTARITDYCPNCGARMNADE